MASMRSSGRGRLPAWLVRMRSRLCLMAVPLVDRAVRPRGPGQDRAVPQRGQDQRPRRRPSRIMAAGMDGGGVQAIAIRELTKQYASRAGAVTALDRISFSVGEGEFVAVVGPSGCGKSTLLKIIDGILPESSTVARLRRQPC